MSRKYYAQMEIKDGLNALDIEKGIFEYIRGFAILSLGFGKEISLESREDEVGLVILSGKCDIEVEKELFTDLGSRENVFQGLPTAVYIPRHKKYKIKSKKAEIAICSCRCDKDSKASVILPEEIKEMSVGKDNWRRQVRIIIGQNAPSINLIVGETINPAGNWSGTPSHKHEVNNPPAESLHEELYYFKTDKKQGFGIELLYSPERNVDALIRLKENTVTFMPWGYHQIVAGPGYALYYLFFLSGAGKNLIGSPDPNHKWLNE